MTSMTENDDKYKHIFVSRTFSRFAEENESLIAAVIADDVAAVAAHLDALPDAVLWLNPLKREITRAFSSLHGSDSSSASASFSSSFSSSSSSPSSNAKMEQLMLPLPLLKFILLYDELAE